VNLHEEALRRIRARFAPTIPEKFEDEF